MNAGNPVASFCQRNRFDLCAESGENPMPRQYKACLTKVFGSTPPVSFLDELVDWGLWAPNAIFYPNANFDIYSSVFTQLGPYRSTPHRKAVMLEVLRVLAGFESTWRWNEGVDASKTVKNTSHNEETGAFQVSADSMDLDSSLKTFVQTTLGSTDDQTFMARTKTNHKFAIEYAARLLRITINANGPILHHHIHGSLQRAAVSEFLDYIWKVGDFELPRRDTRYA